MLPFKFHTQRFTNTENNFKTREMSLQQDLENASANESKLVERCDELETLYHDTRREKDEQHFELKQIVERAATLEERLKEVEDEKTDLEFELSEMQTSLARFMKQPLLMGDSGLSAIADSGDNSIGGKFYISIFLQSRFF